MTTFFDYLNGLTADPTPDPAADYFISNDISAGINKKVLLSVILALASGAGIPTDGWVPDGDTWTYASADGPTGVFTIAGVDRSAVLMPGTRIKLTQTTPKYFIVTKVAFSTNTTVTIYGGTDYTLANAAITSPNHSPCKTPAGFNPDPDKWTESITDTSDRSQASPTAATWYNPGSLSLSVPIGVWRVQYMAHLENTIAATTAVQAKMTLSTANNSESDVDFTGFAINVGPTATILRGESEIYREKHLALTSKTSYFLNVSPVTASTSSIDIRGDLSKTIIRAVCAYL